MEVDTGTGGSVDGPGTARGGKGSGAGDRSGPTASVGPPPLLLTPPATRTVINPARSSASRGRDAAAEARRSGTPAGLRFSELPGLAGGEDTTAAGRGSGASHGGDSDGSSAPLVGEEPQAGVWDANPDSLVLDDEGEEKFVLDDEGEEKAIATFVMPPPTAPHADAASGLPVASVLRRGTVWFI